MKISDRGLDIIKLSEGLRLEAYPDPGTGGEPWTIGFGHTGGVKPGDVIDEAEADRLLRVDVADAEECVSQHVAIEINQNQFDALVCFVYNVGCGAFRGSTLLRLVNAYQFETAAKQFPRWDKAAGKALAGLAKRRRAEMELFVA